MQCKRKNNQDQKRNEQRDFIWRGAITITQFTYFSEVIFVIYKLL